MKQTALLYLKFSLKPAFLVYFCYFWKDNSFLILNLFISEYLDQIPPWKENKDAFSVTLQTENLFLFKIKIKQNSGCQNKEYNTIFKNIHQSIRGYSRSKENLHWSMIVKISHIEKNLSKVHCWRTIWVCSRYIGGSGGAVTPESLETVFPALNWHKIVI